MAFSLPSLWRFILPNENLVKNIGFSSNATHTKRGESYKIKFFQILNLLGFTSREPSFYIRSIDADIYTFNHSYYPKFHIKVINKF